MVNFSGRHLTTVIHSDCVTLTPFSTNGRYMKKANPLATAVDAVLAAVAAAADIGVTERELVELGLDFANRGVLRSALLHVPGVNLPWALPAPDGRRPANASLVVFDVRLEPAFKVRRERLKRDLAALLSRRLKGERFDEIKELAQHVVLTPTYALNEDRRLQVRHHVVPRSLDAVLAHIVMLLASDFSGEIRQCALEGCDAFYLTGDRDKRSAKFCSEEHQAEHRRMAGAARQERYRRRHGAK